VADLTPAQLLAATAADMRAVADAATKAPWRYNPNKHWRRPESCEFEEAVFAGPAGKDAVCVTVTGPSDDPQSMTDGVHIGAWDPAVTRSVADLLTGCTHVPFFGLCETVLCRERERQLPLCEAWWTSRGIEPPAPSGEAESRGE
jgi:hypothetical protein